MPHIDADHARRALAASYRAVTHDAGQLDEGGVAQPSQCLGWTRGDLLFHTLLDAQRALVTLATPAPREPDADFVSYWAPFRPGGEGYDAHARFVRRASSAYRSDLVIVAQWRDTAAAAVHVAAAVPGGATLATQGHVLRAGDFLATLAVEASIHHLDLLASGGTFTGPAGDGLAIVRQTLDGVLGQPVPAPWDDRDYALKATGRAELSPDDRACLGNLVHRFPLLG